MDFLKEVWAFIKTPKFWTWFAVITIADYLFFNRALLFVPLIPQLYKFYDMVGLNKLLDMFKPNTQSTGGTRTTRTTQSSTI